MFLKLISQVYYMVGSLLGKENNKIVKNYINDFVEGIFEKDIDKINKNLSDYLMIFSTYSISILMKMFIKYY